MPASVPVPAAVLLQESRAITLMWREIDASRLRGLDRGRPRKAATPENAPVLAVFVSDSLVELDVLQKAWDQAIGQPVRGNKRLGRPRLSSGSVSPAGL